MVLTNTIGTAGAAAFCTGRVAFTSFQLSSAGSLLKLAGSVLTTDHGPVASVAFNQVFSCLR